MTLEKPRNAGTHETTARTEHPRPKPRAARHQTTAQHPAHATEGKNDDFNKYIRLRFCASRQTKPRCVMRKARRRDENHELSEATTRRSEAKHHGQQR